MNTLLNSFPPASYDFPDIGLSVLKSYLQKNNMNCDIIYWNLILRDITREYIKDESHNDILTILIPYLYAFDEMNGKARKKNFENLLLMRHPELAVLGKDYSWNFIKKIKQKIHRKISEIITQKQLDENYKLIGISYKFSQWIPGIYFLKILKKKNPNIKTVIGGIPTQIEAVKIIETFNDVLDFAVWGEGEVALKTLVEYLDTVSYISEIPSLVFKNDEKININTLRPQYSEFVLPIYDEFIRDSSNNSILNIESSRGCYWNKCKFCYLNEGYKFRLKNPDDLINEIDYLSKRYGVNSLSFVDNDVIGGNIKRLISILDKLIEYRNTVNPNLQLVQLEINTKNVTKDVLKKMSEAGIKSFQFGLEAISNSLLKKMQKESRFINHILTIKFSCQYNINLLGPNIIKGILDETDSDIIESIENISYLRFYFSNGLYIYPVPLNIRYTSKYYNEIVESGQLNNWENAFFSLLPNYVQKNSIYFFEHSLVKEKSYWMIFDIMLKFYSQNKFHFTLEKNDSQENTYTYLYREYYNELLIEEIEFDNIDYEILNYCNDRIVDLEELFIHIKNIDGKISNKRLLKLLDELDSKKIILFDKKLNKIITIIDSSIEK